MIGYQQTSSSLRGFYLTGALEIEGASDPREFQQRMAAQLFSAESMPSDALCSMLRYRINPERASGKHITLGYHFTYQRGFHYYAAQQRLADPPRTCD